MKGDFIAVDWGTTNFRAFLLAEGKVIDSQENDGGLMALRSKAVAEDSDLFEQHLAQCVGEWMKENPDIPIVLSGMIGSNKGWIEAPYCSCPASQESIAEKVCSVPNEKGWKIFLLPGLCCESSEGKDVMRGEETQLIGLDPEQRSGLVCLPGTHSKWVNFSDGSNSIKWFKTYMTGEMYSILRANSILKFSCSDGTPVVDPNTPQFKEGVRLGYETQNGLSHVLFLVRTRSMFEAYTPEQGDALLSGILIGNELAGLKDVFTNEKAKVTLVGSTSLCNSYKNALATLGIEADIMDATHASCIGAHRIYAAYNT
eukprot:m.13669 g.13669  ORF g.13669 m.13669 type:complete len:314 (+) comp4896_c0_seq2:215-1156(+)